MSLAPFVLASDGEFDMKDILKNYSTYDIDRFTIPLINGGLLELINGKLQLGKNPTTTNTLPDYNISLLNTVNPSDETCIDESLNDIKPYVQSNPFQCDLSDIIRSNISSHLKKQPLEQIELIKMIKANSLLSQIDSVIIIEELDKMVVDHYIKIDNGKYYKVIY
jgi:hypothetical protein